MTTFLINPTNQILKVIDNATIWDFLQHYQSLGVYSTRGHLQIPERSEIQSYTNPTQIQP